MLVLTGTGQVCQKPSAPADMMSAQSIQSYLREVRAYETAMKKAGKFDERIEEWCEEQSEFYGMRGHLLMMRGGDDGIVDVSQYQAAAKHKREMAADPSPAFIGTSWQHIGPNNLDGTTSAQFGPVTGRVNAVRYSPTDPANDWWVGGATGGLMQTTNNGSTFVTKSDFWDYTYTSDIEIDPTNVNRMYVATGDYPGWWGYGMGLMRSTNGGSTWTQELVTELQGCEVSDILIDPDDTGNILVTAGRGTGDTSGTGVWRSTDFGNTWTRVISNFDSSGYTKLTSGIRVNNERWIYAGAGDGGVVKRSSDGGATWSTVFLPSSGMTVVAASKTHRDVVYAYVAISKDVALVYKSTDNGDNWTSIMGNLNTITGDPGDDTRQCTYNYLFDVINTSSAGTGNDILLLGMVDLFALVNPQGSTNWSWINGVSGQTRNVHADYHGIAQHPTVKSTALIANDGGVWQMSYVSGFGFVFTSRNAALDLTEHVFNSPHPDASNNPDFSLTGMWHLGCAWGASVNNWNSVSGGDGMWCAIDDTNPLLQYVSSQRGEDQTTLDLRATQNSWVSSASYSTSTLMTEDFAFASPWSEVPGDSGAIYLAGETLYEFDLSTGSGVWTKGIGGADFSQTGFTEYCTAIRAVTGPGCFVATNRGRLFGSLTPSTGMPLLHDFVGVVSSIKQHPSDPDDLLVSIGGVDTGPGTSGAVWEVLNATSASPSYIDRSGTGQNSLPGIGVNWIERDPYDPTSTWYAATDLGVFYTRNRGTDWYSVSEALGLPNCMVYHLEVSDNILYASTFGRGIWRMSLFTGPPQTTAITFASTEVTGGNTTTAHITLSRQAPTGGIDIPITSNNLAAIPTQVVHFPGGVTGANVQIDTNIVTADSTVTVTANLGSAPVTDTIIVRECVVNDLLLVDTVGGDPALFGVAINRAAPTGGLVVNLADNDPGTTTPPSVTIAEGNTIGIFVCDTALTPVNRVVGIQASGPGSGWQESFNRLPVFVSSVAITPNPVWNTQPSAIRVTLNRAAPSSGFPFQVDIGTPAIATAPTAFTIPQGSTNGTNPITTFYVPTDSTAGFRVWDPYGQFWEPTLTVKHLGVVSVSYSPNPIVGGNAGGGGVIVDRTVDSLVNIALSTDRPDILGLPSGVSILPGQSSGAYVAGTAVVATPQVAKITAQLGTQHVAGAYAETNLTILPSQIVVAPSSFTVNLGQVNTGNVASLSADDGNVLRICKFIVPNQQVAPVTVQIDGSAPVTSATGLKLEFRSRMQSSGVFSLTLDLWNWSTNNWDTTNVLTTGTNTSFVLNTLTATGSISNFLRSSDGALRARYRVRQTGPSSAILWCQETDRANWIVTP